MSSPAVNARVGDNIRLERTGQRLSLKQLAVRADCSVSLLSQVERGESAISVAVLCRVAHALGIQPGALLVGTSDVVAHRDAVRGDIWS